MKLLRERMLRIDVIAVLVAVIISCNIVEGVTNREVDVSSLITECSNIFPRFPSPK